jgi:LCP family protein required for cell wall assembly
MSAAERRPRGRHVRGPWRPSTFGGALGTVLMSAVLPGSAQLAAGRKVIGRTALAVWILLLLGGLGAVGYILSTGEVTDMAALAVRHPRLISGVQIGALVLGAAWLLLLLDAWRTTRPLAWPIGQRTISTVTTAVVAAAGVVPVYFTAQYAGASHGLVTDVFQEKADESSFTAQRSRARPNGRINVLLLGGDGATDREGVRTDSMQVASIDRRTGKAVLIALPRSLQKAPFPEESPIAELFPNGFDDLLTNLYPFGTSRPDLFPGASDPGAEAIMQAAGEITGLPIHNYVLVNLGGFRDVVDAIGGIDMYVNEPVPIGGERYADGSVKVEPTDWIEPGQHHLDGYHALWFARGRFNSDDYSRMRRQRCVMGAILEQANPTDVLLRYQQIASSAKRLMTTNISRSELSELVEIAGDTRKHKVVSVTFTRKLINTVDPDFDGMREVVREAITESLRPGSSEILAAPTPTPGATGKAGSGGGPTRQTDDAPGTDETADPEVSSTPEPQDATGDLDAVCRYS